MSTAHELFGEPEQYSMFKALARTTDPKSSKVAAKKAVESGLVKSHTDRLIYWLMRYPGSTTKQVEELSRGHEYQISHVQAGKRTKELKEKGLIRVDESKMILGCHPLHLINTLSRS